MVKMLDFLTTSFDEETPRGAVSATYGSGVITLPYPDRTIYDDLAFAFSAVKSGSLAINGFLIDLKNRQKARVYQLTVAIGGVASVTGVFVLSSVLKEATSAQRKISAETQALKELPSGDEAEKRAKLQALFEVFAQNGVAYVLADLNDKETLSHAAALYEVAARTNLTVVILAPKAAPLETQAPAPRPGAPVVGLRAFLTSEFVTYVFLAVFSLLAEFGGFVGVALLGSQQNTSGGVSLATGLLCFIMDLYVAASLYRSYLTNPQSDIGFLEAELMGSLTIALSVAGGALLGFLMAHYGFLATASDATSFALAFSAVIGACLLVSSLGSRPLSRFFYFFSSLFSHPRA